MLTNVNREDKMCVSLMTGGLDASTGEPLHPVAAARSTALLAIGARRIQVSSWFSEEQRRLLSRGVEG